MQSLNRYHLVYTDITPKSFKRTKQTIAFYARSNKVKALQQASGSQFETLDEAMQSLRDFINESEFILRVNDVVGVVNLVDAERGLLITSQLVRGTSIYKGASK